jgi:hypothetical protein
MISEIGRVDFSFEGDSEITHLIIKEFPKSNKDMESKLNVNIKSTQELSKISGDIKKSESGRFYDTGYVVTFPKKNNTMSIAIDDSVLSKGFIEKVAKIKDWNYLTPKEIVAKNLIYDILEPAAHELVVKKGMGFIHASAVAKDDTCFLFTGEGGIGKTAMCLIASEMGYEYLNDDLSLVDSQGNCFHHPKRLQIYGYNIKNSRNLKRQLFKGRGFMDKFQFNLRNVILGPKKVRRRIPPNELFDKIRESAKISRIFFLSHGNELKIHDMDQKRFIESELKIIQKEFSDYVNGITLMNKSKLDAIIGDTKKLYNSLYETTECMEVLVPPSQDLKKIFLKIESENSLSSK